MVGLNNGWCKMKNLVKNKPNSIDSQLRELEDIRSQIERLKEQEEDYKELVVEYYKTKIEEAYKEKGDKFGTIKIEEEFGKLKFDTPKKVKWDQNILKKLYEE